MKCIIIDDNPIASEGIKSLIDKISQLIYLASFDNAKDASAYIKDTAVDLIFLDVNMQGINGIEFIRSIPEQTLIISTTTNARYDMDSYEVEAIDYLVKPIKPERFQKAVEKAILYHSLLMNFEGDDMETDEESMFVKSEHGFLKIEYNDILYIEGLKNCVVIHTDKNKSITKIYFSAIVELLPARIFLRINEYFIANKNHIESFDIKNVYINSTKIAIGDAYREEFFRMVAARK